MAKNQEFPILLDWLTFSGHFSSFNEALLFLGIAEYIDYFKECPGKWFYKYGFTYDGIITIYLGQKNDVTMACVNISGQGVRFIESFSKISLDTILEYIYSVEGFNCSRVDIAMDIVDKSFNIKTLVNATEKENYVCRSKFRNIMNSVDNGIQAYSLYFGRKDSNIFVNIYDKRAERGFTPADMDNWTRIEIRLRHENAQGFLYKYFSNDCDLGYIFSGILNNYLRFVTPGTDKNKSRWNTAPYWKRLLSHADIVKVFFSPGVEYNYSKYENDLIQRCGSTIKTYFELGNTPYDLMRLIDCAGVELNSKQKFLVDNYNEEFDISFL